MAKIISPSLELRVLRTLTSTRNRRRLAKLSGKLQPEYFYSPAASEAYQRIMTLARERSVIISWEELCQDLTLKEETRKRLQGFKKPIIRGKSDLDGNLRLLQEYQQARAVYFACEYGMQQMQRERIDPQKLYLEMAEKLTAAKAAPDSANWFAHIGQSDREARRFARALLSNKVRESYIPTGFRQFDRENVGIPRGSFWLIASNTSGGKSVLANQVGGAMAETGARVCIIQLEMTNLETGQRHLARVGEIDMARIIDPRKLSARQKRRATRRWMAWHQKIKRRGGLLSIFAPEEDLTIEQILLILKPFRYDVYIIDYIGLLKGVDETDYPRLLGRVARQGKRFAAASNCVVAACAQMTMDNILRYSRQMQEHAQNMWTWTYGDKERESRIIEVNQPKSRNQRSFKFYLLEDFRHMRMTELDDQAIRRHQRQAQTEKTRQKNKKPREKSREILTEQDFVDLPQAG